MFNVHYEPVKTYITTMPATGDTAHYMAGITRLEGLCKSLVYRKGKSIFHRENP